MSNDDLERLARQWVADADPHDVMRAVTRATGSPWMLLQLLVTGARDPLEEHGLLSGLPESAAELLGALALLEVPLPMSVLATFAPDPGPEAIGALEQRGIVQRSASGLRLHDVARGMLRSNEQTGRDTARAGAVADALAAHDLPETALEAARLHAETGSWARVRSLLDERAPALLGQGFAPRLWRILADATHPDVAEWRLRCAAELGNPTALARVQRPTADDPAATLAWARTLRAQGDAREALEVLARLIDANANARLRSEADLLASACLRQLGRHAEAAERVADGPPGEDADLVLGREAARAVALALSGDVPPEVALGELRRMMDAPDLTPEAARDLGEALEVLGSLPEAHDMATVARAGFAPVLLASREALLLDARIGLASGRLDAARRSADEVRVYARGASLLVPVLHVVDLTRRLVAGELDGLDPLAAACAAEVAGSDARAEAELASVRITLATLRADDAHEVAAIPEHARASRAGSRAALREALREVRRTGIAVPHDVEAGRQEEVLGLRIAGTTALTTGDAARATAALAEAVRVARRWSLSVLEAEARHELCDALACAERFTDLATEADALNELARSMGSERFVHEAAWLAAAARNEMGPGPLERAAGREEVAPVGARRARAILGGEPPLDHVDLRVLESLTASGRTHVFETILAPPPTLFDEQRERWVPGWGIDDLSHSAWLSDGREVALAGLPWRILATLAARGEASKEDLVLGAWEEREYHPGRHDGRLHVAMRKLREQLGDSGERPSRIVTTDRGYALGGVVRRRRSGDQT